jgi:PAS domain S-box-containing protein
MSQLSPSGVDAEASEVVELRRRVEELEAALRAVEGEKRALLGSLPDMIFRVSRDGRYLAVDVRAENEGDLALPRPLLIGRRVSEVLPPSVAETIERTLARIFAERRPASFDYELDLHGERRVFRAMGSVSGEDEAFFVVHDITEQDRTLRALRENETRYREIFEGANDVICLFDLKGSCLAWNPAGERLFGYSEAEVLAMPAGELLNRIVAVQARDQVRDAFRRKVREGVKQTRYEVDGVTKDGGEVALEISSQVLFRDGKPFAIQGVMRDVTERRRAEAELRRSEEQFRELFENANDIIYRHDLNGQNFTGNRTAERLLGYQRGEGVNLSFRDFVAPEHLERAQAAIAEKLAGKADATAYELDVIARDGRRLTLEVSTRLIYENGAPVGIQGIARDITERKAAEKALRESEEKYRELFENANDIIYIHDLNGRYMTINKTAERVFGYTREEATELSMATVIVPEHMARAKQAVAEKLAGNARSTKYELDVFARDGHRVTLEVSSRMLTVNGEPVGIQGIARDVTDRKLSEKALRESEERYRALFENANDLLYVHNLDGYFLDINPATTRTFGYTAEEARHVNVLHLITPESRSVVKKAIASLLSNPNESVEYEAELFARDGRRVLLELSSRAVLRDGVPVGIQGIARDITERRLAERALRESEERFRRIFEEAPIGIQIVTVTGEIVRPNRTFCEFLGYEPEELIGKSYAVLNHPDEVGETLRHATRLLLDPNISNFQTEKRYLHKDGRVMWGKLTGVAIRDAEGKPIYGLAMVEDLSTRRELEDQLRHAQKMEAVGQLAAGIAHEFNNLITVMTGYAAMIERRFASGQTDPASLETMHRYIKEILEATARAGLLTGQLLAFGRKQPQQLKPLSLNDVVSDTLKMLRPILSRSLEITTELAPDIGGVLADPHQMEQVVTNLAVNARDAMPDGGRLTIRTANVWREARSSQTIEGAHYTIRDDEEQTTEMQSYVMLEVSDTGDGMDEDMQKRIFEPFFTTKPVGRGTGLGLSVVEGIVAQSKGNITVSSRPGEGTTFRVLLPRA